MSYLKDHDRPPESKTWQEIDVAKLDPELVEAFMQYHTLPPGRAKDEALPRFNKLADADEEYPSYDRSDLFSAILGNYEASKAAKKED